MSLDLDALVARARLTAGHDAAVLLMPHEALALVAEVERLRADAANWRAVRDEVLRLDERPGTMADDDVLSVVGAVLRRAAKKGGKHRREENE